MTEMKRNWPLPVLTDVDYNDLFNVKLGDFGKSGEYTATIPSSHYDIELGDRVYILEPEEMTALEGIVVRTWTPIDGSNYYADVRVALEYKVN